MIWAAALAGYAVAVGVVAPLVLSKARWPHRAPMAAVVAWQGLMVTFVLATAVAAYHALLVERHVHDGLAGLLDFCGAAAVSAGASAPTLTDWAALLLPASLLLTPTVLIGHTAWRTRAARRRHVQAIDLIGSPAPEYGATVVDHAVPAVYCVPGRARRIVVTKGALDALTDRQLRAVLEHERAHISGRHHLFQVVTKAFARTFPKLPLARHADEQTTLLLEMAADDRALRHHPRDVVAAAMYQVAAGGAPHDALGAGGPGALIRLRRVLGGHPRPPRSVWWSVAVASLAAPLLPLLVACGPA